MPSYLRLPTAAELRARAQREAIEIRAGRTTFRCFLLDYLRSL